MPGTASPTSTPPVGTSEKDRPVPDDLHRRYQAAHLAYQAHADACQGCTRDTPNCQDGQRLRESFTRLQDAYLTRQRSKR
ncbi:hypothetical protein AMK32_36090 [Streptomyces sp. CB01883]|nr:hypothetical protein AMK32_36090 [Streptomyces sp. CB01883]